MLSCRGAGSSGATLDRAGPCGSNRVCVGPGSVDQPQVALKTPLPTSIGSGSSPGGAGRYFTIGPE